MRRLITTHATTIPTARTLITAACAGAILALALGLPTVPDATDRTGTTATASAEPTTPAPNGHHW